MMDELTETHEDEAVAYETPEVKPIKPPPAEEKAADAFDHEKHLIANGFRLIRGAWRR